LGRAACGKPLFFYTSMLKTRTQSLRVYRMWRAYSHWLIFEMISVPKNKLVLHSKESF